MVEYPQGLRLRRLFTFGSPKGLPFPHLHLLCPTEVAIAKNRNTYAKRQREQEKKERADRKRARRDQKKEIVPGALPEDQSVPEQGFGVNHDAT